MLCAGYLYHYLIDIENDRTIVWTWRLGLPLNHTNSKSRLVWAWTKIYSFWTSEFLLLEMATVTKKVVIDQNVILPTLVIHFIHCDRL